MDSRRHGKLPADLTVERDRDTLRGLSNRGAFVDHISLSDPVTWAGVLIAAFLIAGLRWLVRGGGRRKPPQD